MIVGNVPQAELFKAKELEGAQKKATIIDNCTYFYRFYGCAPQFSYLSNRQFAIPSSTPEEQKEQARLFSTQNLPLLPFARNVMDGAYKVKENGDFFKVRVDKEYYGELYSKQN